jgi:hypothetical protein
MYITNITVRVTKKRIKNEIDNSKAKLYSNLIKSVVSEN